MSIYQHNTGDMLMIFEYDLDKLHEFHNLANSLHPRIKIELRFSNGQIEFLNVNVSINNGHIKTDLFSKVTDKHVYLHVILYGLGVRAKRICSNENDH